MKFKNKEIEHIFTHYPWWGGGIDNPTPERRLAFIEKQWAHDYAHAVDIDPPAWRTCADCKETNHFVDSGGFFQGGWDPKTKKFLDEVGALCRACTDKRGLDFGER